MGKDLIIPLYVEVIAAPKWGEPVTTKFYPDPHPEVSSVDGQVKRTNPTGDWADVHDGPGTGAEDKGASYVVGLRCGPTKPNWYEIYRAPQLYDTSPIPPGSLIDAAEVGEYVEGKINDWGGANFGLGVYESYPTSNTALVAADYGKLYAVQLATPILYNSITVGAMNVFTLNAAGLMKVIPGGITKLALRESQRDAPNAPPPWLRYALLTFAISSADTPFPAQRPYLKVTYRPKL